MATAADIAAVMTPKGNGNATVAKLVAGGIQGAASAVAANARGNDLNVTQNVAADFGGAVAGVAETASPAAWQAPGAQT